MTSDEGFASAPLWNEEASSLLSFEERIKLYVMGTKIEDRDYWHRWILRTSHTK